VRHEKGNSLCQTPLEQNVIEAGRAIAAVKEIALEIALTEAITSLALAIPGQPRPRAMAVSKRESAATNAARANRAATTSKTATNKTKTGRTTTSKTAAKTTTAISAVADEAVAAVVEVASHKKP